MYRHNALVPVWLVEGLAIWQVRDKLSEVSAMISMATSTGAIAISVQLPSLRDVQGSDPCTYVKTSTSARPEYKREVHPGQRNRHNNTPDMARYI